MRSAARIARRKAAARKAEQVVRVSIRTMTANTCEAAQRAGSDVVRFAPAFAGDRKLVRESFQTFAPGSWHDVSRVRVIERVNDARAPRAIDEATRAIDRASAMDAEIRALFGAKTPRFEE